MAILFCVFQFKAAINCSGKKNVTFLTIFIFLIFNTVIVLLNIYYVSGKNKKLGLSGRPSDAVGIQATSTLYTLGDQTLAFFPQVFVSVPSTS